MLYNVKCFSRRIKVVGFRFIFFWPEMIKTSQFYSHSVKMSEWPGQSISEFEILEIINDSCYNNPVKKPQNQKSYKIVTVWITWSKIAVWAVFLKRDCWNVLKIMTSFLELTAVHSWIWHSGYLCLFEWIEIKVLNGIRDIRDFGKFYPRIK